MFFFGWKTVDFSFSWKPLFHESFHRLFIFLVYSFRLFQYHVNDHPQIVYSFWLSFSHIIKTSHHYTQNNQWFFFLFSDFREALPRLDNYRLSLRTFRRPSISLLHGEVLEHIPVSMLFLSFASTTAQHLLE